jgi:hypothetical protein
METKQRSKIQDEVKIRNIAGAKSIVGILKE